jgi:hypothetical protein
MPYSQPDPWRRVGQTCAGFTKVMRQRRIAALRHQFGALLRDMHRHRAENTLLLVQVAGAICAASAEGKAIVHMARVCRKRAMRPWT